MNDLLLALHLYQFRTGQPQRSSPERTYVVDLQPNGVRDNELPGSVVGLVRAEDVDDGLKLAEELEQFPVQVSLEMSEDGLAGAGNY